ncbi:MAG: super-infection exclusion protein B [Phycisphaeraceae bacterium]
MNWNKLVEIIYTEKDFGRSIATSIAGVVGLSAYFLFADWVIAVFALVISYPLFRVIASAIHSRWKKKRTQLMKDIQAKEKFNKFSPQERQVIEFFVRSGGACVSWGYVNNSKLPFPRPAVNSLIQRGIVHTTVMEDDMTEAFALDTDVFDTAQRVFGPPPPIH